MQNNKFKKVYFVPVIIIIIAAIGIWQYFAAYSGVSTPDQNISYALITGKTAYSENEQIPMVVTITNKGNMAKTFRFENGCQLLYTVENFEMKNRIRCLPEASSFTILPGGSHELGITHYPTIYRIPVGPHDLKVQVVGYTEIKTPITITN